MPIQWVCNTHCAYKQLNSKVNKIDTFIIIDCVVLMSKESLKYSNYYNEDNIWNLVYSLKYYLMYRVYII